MIDCTRKQISFRNLLTHAKICDTIATYKLLIAKILKECKFFMNFVSGILKRANIQQIREFLNNGVDLSEISDASCEKRINDSWNTAKRIFLSRFSEESEELNEFLLAVSEYGDVYMEVGIKAGFQLAADFQSNRP